MFYVIHINPTLLQQKNDDSNKVYLKKSADYDIN